MSSPSSSYAAPLSSSLKTQLFNPFPNRLISSEHFYEHRSSKCEMSRKGFTLKGGLVAFGVLVMGSSLITEPTQGVERLEFKPEGYNFWTWRGHRIHYVVQGEGFPIVLIHGFGASAFQI